MPGIEDTCRAVEEQLLAAYSFVENMNPQADTHTIGGVFPLWHGWALREAFLAGIAWERERQLKERAKCRP